LRRIDAQTIRRLILVALEEIFESIEKAKECVKCTQSGEGDGETDLDVRGSG
jgi:hypothetical protein